MIPAFAQEWVWWPDHISWPIIARSYLSSMRILTIVTESGMLGNAESLSNFKEIHCSVVMTVTNVGHLGMCDCMGSVYPHTLAVEVHWCPGLH